MITKTPIPIKKPSTVADLISKLSVSIGKKQELPAVEELAENTPRLIVPKKKTDVSSRLVNALGRACAPLCEICRSKGASMHKAKCGHFTWLCVDCHRSCRIAMVRCEKCDAKYTAKQLAAVGVYCTVSEFSEE